MESDALRLARRVRSGVGAAPVVHLTISSRKRGVHVKVWLPGGARLNFDTVEPDTVLVRTALADEGLLRNLKALGHHHPDSWFNRYAGFSGLSAHGVGRVCWEGTKITTHVLPPAVLTPFLRCRTLVALELCFRQLGVVDGNHQLKIRIVGFAV
jgi:hypothetical protein